MTCMGEDLSTSLDLRPRFNPGGIQRYTGKALFRVFIASSEEPKSASRRLQCSSWKGHSQRKAF
ncbi:hypothetical protein AnigIFM60653_004581 [Aspergillus niger]|nr:hypothetical protein AnigIFM60653_004581 [Aspergillus niger]